MSKRTTEKELQSLVDRINKLTGNPNTQYTKGTDGRFKANIGNYHIYYAYYSGVQLNQTIDERDAVTCPLSTEYHSKKELADQLRAFITGLSYKKGS